MFFPCVTVEDVVLEQENTVEGDWLNWQSKLDDVECLTTEEALTKAGCIDPHLRETQGSTS